MSMIGVPIILAPVFGPTIGGLLVEHAGWEWIFFVNIPIGILAVALGRKLLPADEPEHAGRLDALGLALIATGLVGITYGLAETGATGTIASARVLVPLLGGLALVADVPHPRRCGSPSRCSTSACSPTARSPRRRSRRSASAPRCSGR